MEAKEIFWKESFDGEAQGGIYFRSVELNNFIREVEANTNGNGGEVVGVRFDGNNIEIIIKKGE